MKILGKDLKNYINKNKIENIYLFAGPEIGEKKEVIRLIEKKLFPDDNITKYIFYCGDDFDPSDFITTLETGLLFSSNKLVILENVEQINTSVIKLLERYIIPRIIEVNIFNQHILAKIDQGQQKKILKIYNRENNVYKINDKVSVADKKLLVSLFHQIGFANYNPGTYLIMMNETNDKIPEALTQLIAQEQNIMFWEMFQSQKKEWIRQEFKKNGMIINEEALSFILDMIENNKEQLENEIVKIGYLFKESGDLNNNLITRKLLEEYLYHSKQETPFSLYSALLCKNTAKAVEILGNLFLTDEYSLLNGIVWSHRRFLKALDLYENQKYPLNEIFSTLNINIKQAQEDFSEGLKNYNFIHISMLYYELTELDYYLKILPQELKLIKLQLFVIKFIHGEKQKFFLQGPLQYLQY